MQYLYEHYGENNTPPENGCSLRFRIDQRFAADALEECPDCGGPVRRVIVNPHAIVYKGRGWSQKDIKMELEVEKRISEGDIPKPWDFASTGYYPGPGEGFLEPSYEFARQVGSGQYHDERGEKL